MRGIGGWLCQEILRVRGIVARGAYAATIPVMSDSGPTAPGVLRRGLAWFLDVMLLFSGFVLSQLVVLTPLREALGIDEDAFRAPVFTAGYVLLTVSLPVWLWLAGWESSRWQATPAKRLLRMRVERVESGDRPGFRTALGRTLVKLIPWELSHLIAIFPTPVYFAAEDADFRWAFLGPEALVLGYLLTVVLRKDRRAPHDLFAGTRVVAVTRPVR